MLTSSLAQLTAIQYFNRSVNQWERLVDVEIEKTVEIPILDNKKLKEPAETMTARERAWTKWFNSLSEEDKNIVEICEQRGASITAANFEQAKAIVKKHFPDI